MTYPAVPDAPKCLDLCCAGGGASMGLFKAGFDMTGVDINPQPNYPFKFILADAIEVSLDGYDCFWASPPCQKYTHKQANWGRKRTHFYNHPDLIAPIRERLQATGKPYILENVNGAPLNGVVML